eukprot:m.452138 g.452138  ORF g.452138 m.452138 type:complete len:211 (+) comp20274_c0_seq1:84-716(+)
MSDNSGPDPTIDKAVTTALHGALDKEQIVRQIYQEMIEENNPGFEEKLAERIGEPVTSEILRTLGKKKTPLAPDVLQALREYLNERKVEVAGGTSNIPPILRGHASDAAATGSAFATASIAAFATAITALLSAENRETDLYCFAWWCGVCAFVAMIVGGFAAAAERAFAVDPEWLVAVRTGMAWLFSVLLIFLQAFVSKMDGESKSAAAK